MKKYSIVASTTILLGCLSQSYDVRADHTQVTENLRWCYQEQTRVESTVSLNGYSVGSVNIGTVPRSWYIGAIQEAAAQRDAIVLRVIYKACQAHNARAMEYLDSESDRNLVRAARYVVACKAQQPGGGTPAICDAFLKADANGGGYDMPWPPS